MEKNNIEKHNEKKEDQTFSFSKLLPILISLLLIPILLIIISIIFVYQEKDFNIILIFLICGTFTLVVSAVCIISILIKYLQINKTTEINYYEKSLTNVIDEICGGRKNEKD